MFLLLCKDISAVECTGTTEVDRRTCTSVKTLINIEGFLRNCGLQRLSEDPCVSLSKLRTPCIFVVVRIRTHRETGRSFIWFVLSCELFKAMPFSLSFHFILFFDGRKHPSVFLEGAAPAGAQTCPTSKLRHPNICARCQLCFIDPQAWRHVDRQNGGGGASNEGLPFNSHTLLHLSAQQWLGERRGAGTEGG